MRRLIFDFLANFEFGLFPYRGINPLVEEQKKKRGLADEDRLRAKKMTQ